MTSADLIIHPIRMRIIIALHDRKLTPKQLTAELKDVALATLILTPELDSEMQKNDDK